MKTSKVTGIVGLWFLVHMGTCTNVYQCGSADITCGAGDDCVVNADETNSCSNYEITCPSEFDCSITCTGVDACDEATIHLNDAVSVNITCEGVEPCQALTIEDTCDYLNIACAGNYSCSDSSFQGQGLEDTQIYCAAPEGQSYGCDYSDFWPGDSMNYEVYCTSVYACCDLDIDASDAARVHLECGGLGACAWTEVHAPTDGILEVTTFHDDSMEYQYDLMWLMDVFGYEGSEISVTCDPQMSDRNFDSCSGMVIDASDAESLHVMFGANAYVDDTEIRCPSTNCEIDFSQVTSEGLVSGVEIHTTEALPEGVDVQCNEGDDGVSCEDITAYCDEGSCDFEYVESDGTYQCIGECGIPPTIETTSGSVWVHHVTYVVWFATLGAAILWQ